MCKSIPVGMYVALKELSRCRARILTARLQWISVQFQRRLINEFQAHNGTWESFPIAKVFKPIFKFKLNAIGMKDDGGTGIGLWFFSG